MEIFLWILVFISGCAFTFSLTKNHYRGKLLNGKKELKVGDNYIVNKIIGLNQSTDPHTSELAILQKCDEYGDSKEKPRMWCFVQFAGNSSELDWPHECISFSSKSDGSKIIVLKPFSSKLSRKMIKLHKMFR